jgi:UDP-glucose 4-epimerase
MSPQFGSRSETVLVTGASGFVGRHVVQQLCGRGWHVRALVRRVPKEGFHPSVEVVIGDLSQPESYRAALNDATAVVHAALTDKLADEPQATTALLNLSARAGVLKFIHLSSIAVYGNPPGPTITEETEPVPSSDAYSRTKLAIEEALKATSTDVEITVLRLGCVYGPGAGWWTHGLLTQMRYGNLILVDAGAGIANLIHVSDAAVLVAQLLERSGSRFEIFNVTDGKPLPWSHYFAELENRLGRKATVPMTADRARDYGRKWLQPSVARRVLRKITGAPVIFPLDDRAIENYASRAVYSNAKAVALLHFSPQHDFESGMRTLDGALSSPQESEVAAH